MGKSNAKKMKLCGYIKPHPAHTYDREVQSPQPGAVRHVERKLWCQGVGEQEERAKHVHDWENRAFPIFRRLDGQRARWGETGTPWDGSFECSCGKSVWLEKGRRVEDRFHAAAPLDRIMALKAKLDSGRKLNEIDQKELEAIAQALIEAFKPLMDAMVAMAEQIGGYIQAFPDQIPPETIAQLVELTKAYSGEKGDEVATVDIVNFDGDVIDIVMITPAPISAVNGISLQEGSISSEDQIRLLGGHRYGEMESDFPGYRRSYLA